MSTSNTPSMDQASDPRIAAELREKRKQRISNTLAKRHRKEKMFRVFGFSAVITGLFFVVLLFGSILAKGLPAFWQSSMTVPVYFDPTIINAGAKPTQKEGESPAHFQERYIAWQTEMGMVDWDALIVNGLIAKDPSIASKRDDLGSLYTSSEAYRLRDLVLADPALIGQKKDLNILADANVDVWLAGNIDRSLPDDQQQLSPEVRQIADDLKAKGVIENTFNTNIFTNPDSRSSPATSGLAGAIMGSLFMMLIVIFISIPIGVASAIYLEEFAPKNFITDVVEVNINNLAAVPSIVFGLLGAAIFIGWMHLPISAPLVGGLVLSLMTLPTVIITTRASLKAVPPSIRQAALGLGASRVQTVFHHVLPLAIPGILTGAIIGVAQALGETAPLLLIGMSAFVASVPATPLDQSTALPVQIFLWQGNELRNFFEGRTAAAIIVLLALMVGLNSLAIWLRKKFEVRW
ncbi:phosphate ABC transporter permease PstA [Acinetobacter sp. ANC 4779]|uniref:phosphate ABC transporter permease PstA n=1 Tax=Acinetobacter sp. ANC 4779 TaxID=2529848 RepID=UPI0010396F69|nr:phosphate ABC transporter permease PstA [Acinetobacter sp. ANC 4779]TCB51037.1 phosphate ABC transporter permease PstA [Acinetobacter sp. ANC 4779]